MRLAWALVLAIATGCIDTNAVLCGDITCPAGTTCTPVEGTLFCATDADLRACENVAAGGACSTDLIASGACRDGVCFAAFCGDGRKELDEACDDGNVFSGDDCSSDCMSIETCGNGITDPLKGEACDDGNLLSGDGCDSRCLPELALWENLETESLHQPVGTPVQYPAMAYDEARGVTVMFGGEDAGGVLLDDTWLWNGVGWSKAHPTTRPSPRMAAGMAYDPVRKRVVLFGGRTAAGVVSDTWEWDGETWALIPTADQPLPCMFGAMAYDPSHKRIILFGGSDVAGNSPGFNGAWGWDGVAWDNDLSIAPDDSAGTTTPPFFAHTVVALDAKRGKIVLYGGQSLGTKYTDTWELDGAAPQSGYMDGSWKRVSTTAPSVSGHDVETDVALAWDPATERVVMLGGKDDVGTAVGAAFAWTGSSWTALPALPAAAVRAGHALASDVTRKRIVAFGGEPNRLTHEWEGAANRWNDVSPIVQQSLGEHVAVDTRRGRSVRFDADGSTWEFDGLAWQRVATSGPPPRAAASLVYDAKNDEVVLFGGGDTSADFADTWIYKAGAWTQRVVTGPSARRGATMVYDAKRQNVVLFGGINSANALSDETWLWNGTAWSNPMPAGGPYGRAYAAMAYDPDLELVVLYGGGSITGSITGADSNVYLWNGSAWTMLPYSTPIRPTPRVGAAMSWDPSIHRMVIYGGTSGSVLSILQVHQDTWLWDGSGWDGSTALPHDGFTVLPTNQLPPNRFGAALFTDPRGNGLILFGGHTSGDPLDDFHDTWRLHWRGTTPDEVCRDAGADIDGDGKASCADEDCWALCTPACPPGTDCAPPPVPGCGDGTCNAALETCRLCPQDCGTCSPVCGDSHCDAGETCVADCP